MVITISESRSVLSPIKPTTSTHTLVQPLFAAPLAIKDINHARSIAGQDTELPTLDMALRHLEYVKQHAKERGDLAGIYGAIRALSGLPFENDA